MYSYRFNPTSKTQRYLVFCHISYSTSKEASNHISNKHICVSLVKIIAISAPIVSQTCLTQPQETFILGPKYWITLQWTTVLYFSLGAAIANVYWCVFIFWEVGVAVLWSNSCWDNDVWGVKQCDNGAGGMSQAPGADCLALPSVLFHPVPRHCTGMCVCVTGVWILGGCRWCSEVR